MELDDSELDRFERWLQAQFGGDFQDTWGKFDVAYGAVVWCNWGERRNKPELSVNLLLTEEPHYLKRSWPETDIGTALEDLTIPVEDRLRSAGFKLRRESWQLAQISGDDRPNYHTWVENPLFCSH